MPRPLANGQGPDADVNEDSTPIEVLMYLRRQRDAARENANAANAAANGMAVDGADPVAAAAAAALMNEDDMPFPPSLTRK